MVSADAIAGQEKNPQSTATIVKARLSVGRLAEVS